MLEDYKKAVINTYHEKKEMGKLSLNLSHPTPARLRDECLVALKSRTQKKDELFIKEFFNSGTESNDYSQCVRRFDADKLRPLNNFLKGITEDTEARNIELLAWLMDLGIRPYDYRIDYTKYVRPEEDELTEDKPPIPSPEPPGPTPNPKGWLTTRNVIVSIVVLCLIVGGVYLNIGQTKVYICENGTAKKYHLNPKCPALKNCKYGVVQTTIAGAEKNGKALCGFEHK